MDSDDEDDEFCLDEAESLQSRQRSFYQGGKLNDILAEVETKIPSLDFDEDLHDDGCDNPLIFGYDNGLLTIGSPREEATQSSQNDKPNVLTSESISTQTEYNAEIIHEETENTSDDHVEVSNGKNVQQVESWEGKAGPVQLDFNKLQAIDFDAVSSALGQFTSSKSSLYDTLELNDEHRVSEESDEDELMERLCDLSKDQIKATFSAKRTSSDENYVLYVKKKKHVALETIFSSKSIHSWTQLQTENAERPETVYLDLRQENSSDDTTKHLKHTSSIQRILGLAEKRSANSSEEDSDNDMADWYEMRSKHKEKAVHEKESYAESKKDRKRTSKEVRQRRGMRREVKAQMSFRKKETFMAVENVCDEELLGGIPSKQVEKSNEVVAEKKASITSSETEFSPGLSDRRKKKEITAFQNRLQVTSEVLLQDGVIKNAKQGNEDDVFAAVQTNEKHDDITKDDRGGVEDLNTEVSTCDEIKIEEKENDSSSADKEDTLVRDRETGTRGIFDELSEDEDIVFQETTVSDINHLVASAVRMLDEVYETRSKMHDGSSNSKTFSDSLLTHRETRRTPLDEKLMNEEKYEINLKKGQRSDLFNTSATTTGDSLDKKNEQHRKRGSVGRSSFSELKPVGQGEAENWDGIVKQKVSMSTDDRSATNNEQHRKNGAVYSDTRFAELKPVDKEGTENGIMKCEILTSTDDDGHDVKAVLNDEEEKIAGKQHNVNVYQNKVKTRGEKSLTINEQCSPNCKKKDHKTKEKSPKEIRQLKQKVKERLEGMRPTKSATGKYPAASNTPIIYDQQSSYECKCRSLLPTPEDQLTLLLVVTLLEPNVRSKWKASETTVNDYFALIAWLLSLGGEYNLDRYVPFSIIGMQQVYQNGKMQLFIGVQEPSEFQSNRKNSSKNKIKTFHKAISKYLSTHSLRNVYQKMRKVYLGETSVDETLFSSKMLSTYMTVGQDPNAVQRVFKTKPGFFWATVEVPDSPEVFTRDECFSSSLTENMIVLVQPHLYRRPSCILDLLSRVENEGCDVAGLRLAYSDTFQANYATIFLTRTDDDDVIQCKEPQLHYPSLAVAIRGPSAISKMKTIIGSKIPVLDAPSTVPSLRSLFCTSMSEDKLFYCPSYSTQADVLLSRWFGARITEEELHCTSTVDEQPHSPTSEAAQPRPALLMTFTQVTFYLICSPLVQPSFLGSLLDTCNARGFSLHGIRRMYLNKRQGDNLGLSQLQQVVFCHLLGNNSYLHSPNQSPPQSPGKTTATFTFENTPTVCPPRQPCTVVVLQKENGLSHAKSLMKHIYEALLDWQENHESKVEENACRMYFCTAPFNEANGKTLLENVTHTPDFDLLKKARSHSFWSNAEVDQVCVLCVTAAVEAFWFIGLVLKMQYSADNCVAGNWELLAIKSFARLTLVQAREVTPLEVGDHMWATNVKRLMSTTVITCVFRGINMVQRLCDFMAFFSTASHSHYPEVDWWISQTTEVAFRQIAVLFNDKEISADEKCKTGTKYLPLPKKMSVSNGPKTLPSNKQRSCETRQGDFREMSIIQSLLCGPRPITTVAVIKPSCLLNTKTLGKIFKSICQENFKIVALRMSVLTRSEAQMITQADEPNLNEHVDYLTSGACLVMCLQRENAVKKFLDMLGPDDPVIARNLDPFLLRGCYGVDCIYNAIYGSTSYSKSVREIKTFFPTGLCCEQTEDLEADQIAGHAFDAIIGSNTGRTLSKRLANLSGVTQSLVSSLIQTNCLVLTQHVVFGRYGRYKIALLDVLECLLSLHFIPVAMKMACLTQEQVDNFLNLASIKAEEKQRMKNELNQGSCIVMALQRDNAVTCFDSIIQSAPAKYRSLNDYKEYIVRGTTDEEARNLLLYFFDGLAPQSADEISTM